MAQTKQFESIVRRVKKGDFPVRESEKRIVIDNETGKAVEKTSFLRSYSYYIVSNSTGTRDVSFTSSVFPVTEERNRKINLSIDCHVNCAPGNETRVAESLHQIDKYPGNMLDDFVEISVSEFVKKQGTGPFIDTFFQNREDLQAYVASRLNAMTGLDFQAVKCLLEGEFDLHTIHISLKDVLLRYSDSSVEHPYSTEISLLIDPIHKINAIARNRTDSTFAAAIQKELREFFFNTVSLVSIYKDREKVESDFKTHLNKLLARYGRRIGATTLMKTSPWEPNETLEDFITVYVNVPEYPRPITVENRIFITRVDPSRFNANKPEDLRKWLGENVQNVIKQVYFGCKYDEIIVRSDELENKVKSALKAVVEKIGYNLDQIIIIPTFNELKILEKLEIEIKDEFITRDHKKVKLDVSIKAEGNRRSEKIKRFINNISVLPNEMKSLVRDELIKYLHTIRSDEFYEDFDNEENPHGTVKDKIATIIEKRLKDVFDVTVQYLSFDIGETEIIRVMDELKKGWHEFEFEIASLSEGNKVSFTASFRVQDNALGRWNIFQSQQFSIAEIKERIVAALRAKLGRRRATELSYKNDDDGEYVEGLIRGIAVQAIEESYGLTIIVRDVLRHETKAEGNFDDISHFFEDKIIKLLKDKMEALVEGEFAMAEDLQRRIDQLNESVGSTRIALSVDQRALSAAPAGEENGINPSYESGGNFDN